MVLKVKEREKGSGTQTITESADKMDFAGTLKEWWKCSKI